MLPRIRPINAFITGTDTEIGKTFATALLTRGLRATGSPTVALKPFCCGPRNDVEILAAASDHTISLNETNPVWLHTSAAPLAAATAEKRNISIEPLREWFHGLSSKHSSLLVEGAGGWLVPITETETIADFAALLALPVIVVVPNRLGCLNHTLLTLESIHARGLHCPGIILNHPAPPVGEAARTNAAILSRHVRILLEISHNQTSLPPTALAAFDF